MKFYEKTIEIATRFYESLVKNENSMFSELELESTQANASIRDYKFPMTTEDIESGEGTSKYGFLIKYYFDGIKYSFGDDILPHVCTSVCTDGKNNYADKNGAIQIDLDSFGAFIEKFIERNMHIPHLGMGEYFPEFAPFLVAYVRSKMSKTDTSLNFFNMLYSTPEVKFEDYFKIHFTTPSTDVASAADSHRDIALSALEEIINIDNDYKVNIPSENNYFNKTYTQLLSESYAASASETL